jgi:hypothetical protein
MFRQFRLSKPNGSLLIRTPSFPCGWAIQSPVSGSCQPMSVWPGRLGRLVFAVIKTFSVSWATASWVVSCFCYTRIPSVICFMSFWKINTQMQVAFVWRHASKNPAWGIEMQLVAVISIRCYWWCQCPINDNLEPAASWLFPSKAGTFASANFRVQTKVVQLTDASVLVFGLGVGEIVYWSVIFLT